ncbi:peptide/nickel transport system substrate-binding protein [Rhizobiales bacterium GAS191]|nr:peptide/nickel transport system substrate-binding protein [Rhizobiales bacterium GAS191]
MKRAVDWAQRLGLAMLAALLAVVVPPAAQAEPVKGGTAILAVDADPQTLDPAVSTDYVAGDIGAKIFEGLVWLDAAAMPQPQLATGWTTSDEGRTYVFKLRDGVLWQDGKPFTSADVKFTFEEVLVKYHPRSSNMIKRLGLMVDTPDDKTVVMKLNASYAPFLTQLSVFDAPIIPKHLFAGGDILKNPAAQKPIGTGPFRFVSWERGASVTLDRYEGYWQKGKPYLDRIVFQVIPQPASRLSGLQTGEVDFISDFYLAKADIPSLIKADTFQARIGKALPAIYFAELNLRRSPFDKVAPRHAMAFAIDRNRLVQQAMNGLARPGYGAFGDGFGWTLNPDASYPKLYPYDPEKAKALLAEAGVATGSKLRIAYEAARPQMIATAQIIRENLKQIGFDAVVEPLERTVLLQKVFKDHDFDIALMSYFSSGDPAIGYNRLYVANPTDAINANAAGYADPKVDELLTKAATVTDLSTRGTIYKAVQTILSEDMPAVVLYDEAGVDLGSKKLHGLWKSVDTRALWEEVWLTP